MLSAKKLLLVSAISAISSSAFAMQSMSDQALADTTGQDGLTVSIATPATGISMETRIHDSDGFTGNTSAGAIILGGAAGTNGVLTSIKTPGVTAPIVAVIDAGHNGTNGPVLNIGVTIPTGTIIHTGTIAVADSTGMGNAVTAETAPILNDTQITLGATSLNIQLGNAPQGAMIVANTSMTGGLSMANFALNDVAGGSSISATSILMKDNAGTGNLTVNASVSAKAAGLVVTATQLGSATGFDQQITALKLGGAPAIGNVEVIGLNLNGTTITVAGH